MENSEAAAGAAAGNNEATAAASTGNTAPNERTPGKGRGRGLRAHSEQEPSLRRPHQGAGKYTHQITHCTGIINVLYEAYHTFSLTLAISSART